MAEDILKMDQTSTASSPAGSSASKAKRGHKISVMAAILTLLLAIVLIILGERAIFDLNRSFNPHVIDSPTVSPYSYGGGYEVESSALSTADVYYAHGERSDYKLYRMLIHAAFVIPAFLLVFVLYFWIWHRKTDNPFKVVVFGYLVFGFWMMLHLLFEIAGFVLEEYQNIGIYLVLVFLAALFTWLMVVLQHRINRRKAA
jgi:hypothetical protein